MDTLEHRIQHRIQLGQFEAERLTEYLHTLPADAWRHPSACEAWEVRDVVGHLTLFAELYAGAVSRGVRGDVSPLEGFPPIGALEGASVAPFIAQSAIARRASLGEQLLPTLTARQEQLHHVLAGLTSQDWDTPCYHFVGPFPVRAFYTLRVIELALHGWDIRSALEPGASLFTESLPVLMDLATLRVGGNFRPGVRLAVPIRYRFVITGVVPGPPDLVVEGDQAHWEPRGSAEAHVTYHCDTETFVLLMYSRLTQETATAKGRLVSEGDGQWAVAFDQWFKGS